MLSRAKALALGAPALAALTLALTFAGAGCALEAKQCLETPASPRISSRAVATCEKALGLDLARRDVFHRTVQVLRVRGRYEDIENWARKVLAEHPRRTDAIYALAYALRHQGQYQEALVKYKAYAKANKEDAGAYFGIALCHEALGDRSGAIGAYRKYVARERRDSQRAWRQRAEQRIGALGGGAALASAVSPRPARRVAPPARPAMRVGRRTAATTRRAAPRRTIAAAVTPKAPRATARTARAARPAPAAAAPVNCDAQMAKFKSDPFATKSYDAWAACASRAGRHADVVRYMRIAIRDNPDFKRGWLHLGNAQKALGQTAQAKASWAKACAGSVAEACGR